MKILGVDPGVALTGWGIIKKTKGEAALSACGCIKTYKDQDFEKRLEMLYKEFKLILRRHQPEVTILENLFFSTNAKTAMLVGQARGVVILAAAQEKIPVVEYTPLQVKIAVTGYGRADKNQVKQMIKSILKLKAAPKPDDTTDALAIALTHCFSKNLAERKNL